ncbi:MAG TPA: hypothetical protein VGG35_10035 [Streptosporangiaceae bacterium]|jgi:hypothetical protein
MSLTGREERILDSIRDRLTSSDPGLAQIMGTFARLTADEEMPARQHVRHRRGRLSSRPGRGLRAGRRMRIGSALMLVWLAVSIALISLAVVLSSGSRTCPRLSVAGCPPAGTGSLPGRTGQ